MRDIEILQGNYPEHVKTKRNNVTAAYDGDVRQVFDVHQITEEDALEMLRLFLRALLARESLRPFAAEHHLPYIELRAIAEGQPVKIASDPLPGKT